MHDRRDRSITLTSCISSQKTTMMSWKSNLLPSLINHLVIAARMKTYVCKFQSGSSVACLSIIPVLEDTRRYMRSMLIWDFKRRWMVCYRPVQELDCSTFEDGTVGMPQNFGNELPIYAVQILEEQRSHLHCRASLISIVDACFFGLGQHCGCKSVCFWEWWNCSTQNASYNMLSLPLVEYNTNFRQISH